MSGRRALVIWSLAALLLATYAVALVLLVTTWSTRPVTFGSRTGIGLATVAFSTFPLVGALVVTRQPRNSIGWIFLAVGVLFGLTALSEGYAAYGLQVEGSPPVGTHTMAWLSSWLWTAWVGLIAIFTPLFFPDGRLPSRRWKWVCWVGGVGIFAMAFPQAFTPGPLTAFPGMDNPYGWRSGETITDLVFLAVPLVPIAVVASVVSIFVRFRRSRHEQREQLKWFLFGAALIAVLLLAISVLNAPEVVYGEPRGSDLLRVVEDLFNLSFAALPIAAGIAILKYRLYDIDVIINRTVVYGLLTALLGVAYFAGVALFQAVLPIEDDSGMAVAASTLAIAALFRPLRARVQGFIDRLFYRSKYDAEKTLAAFAARLRDEIDLEQVTDELIEVVTDTMQPERVSLWLRNPAATSSR